MEAIVTDDLELVLRWRECGETTVRFAFMNGSEFRITANVLWTPSLNYQGELTVSFQTMCYGTDLGSFRAELEAIVAGTKTSARFLNTGGDFEIRIASPDDEAQGNLLSALRYRHLRIVGDVPCETEIVLPMGHATDLSVVIKAIADVIRFLKVECRPL